MSTGHWALGTGHWALGTGHWAFLNRLTRCATYLITFLSQVLRLTQASKLASDWVSEYKYHKAVDCTFGGLSE